MEKIPTSAQAVLNWQEDAWKQADKISKGEDAKHGGDLLEEALRRFAKDHLAAATQAILKSVPEEYHSAILAAYPLTKII